MKIQAIDWNKYIQIIYLIRDFYPKYIKKSYNSVLMRQKNEYKNGQRIQTDLLSNKMHMKHTQHH